MLIMSNRKTPNFAYGNFSFQEKGFNISLKENKKNILFSQIENQRFSTSLNNNIMFNSDKALVGMEKQDGN